MKRFITGLLSFFLLLGMLFAAIDIWCFANAFYKKEYSELDTAKDIGISEEDLGKATDTLLEYLKGEREDLVVYADFEEFGEREVFNEREKLHMVDVRDLYQIARMLLYGCAAAAAVLLLLLAIFSGRKGRVDMLSGYIGANIILLCICLAIGIYAVIDFDTFWTSFHHIFFSNDLWLLDPRTDVLIMMVPGKFFFDLVTGIAFSFIGAALTLYISAAVLRKKLGKESSQ